MTSNLDDLDSKERRSERMQTRFIAKAVYEAWRAWAEPRGHKTKEWTDNDDVANAPFIACLVPFITSRDPKQWKPFPTKALVGGGDGALQVALRGLVTYLLDASPHQPAKKPEKQADTGNKTTTRYCPICDNFGKLQSQGAGPEVCPRYDEPWHVKR